MNYQRTSTSSSTPNSSSLPHHPPPVTCGTAPLATADALAGFANGYQVDPRLTALIPGFDAPFFQAGLAGYSDAAMRIMARRHGCPYCMTEALLDRMLLDGGKARKQADLEVLRHNVPASAEDRPLGGQIIGAEADEMATAARILVDLGYDVIDVNLACPVKKIGRKFRGGHFLSHPQNALAVLRAVRESVPNEIVTTVKLRRGADDNAPNSDADFLRIFEGAYEFGYAYAVVHGRTVKQKYNGPSNWDFLRQLVREHPDQIILGSGDIWSAADIFRMLSYTGVQAVSVARGCIGNPWLFRDARQLMDGLTPSPPTLAEQRSVLQQHFELCSAEHGEKLAGRLMRKFGIMFSVHHPNPASVKSEFIKTKNLSDWQRVIDLHYEHAN